MSEENVVIRKCGAGGKNMVEMSLKDYVGFRKQLTQKDRCIAELIQAIVEINPWQPSMAIPNGYRCTACYASIRVTLTPKATEYLDKHKENCIVAKALQEGEA